MLLLQFLRLQKLMRSLRSWLVSYDSKLVVVLYTASSMLAPP